MLLAVIALIWLESLVLAVIVTWKLKQLQESLDNLKTRLKPSKPVQDEAKSIVIDPDDIGLQVRLEHQRRMRELNPEQYRDDN